MYVPRRNEGPFGDEPFHLFQVAMPHRFVQRCRQWRRSRHRLAVRGRGLFPQQLFDHLPQADFWRTTYGAGFYVPTFASQMLLDDIISIKFDEQPAVLM